MLFHLERTAVVSKHRFDKYDRAYHNRPLTGYGKLLAACPHVFQPGDLGKIFKNLVSLLDATIPDWQSMIISFSDEYEKDLEAALAFFATDQQVEEPLRRAVDEALNRLAAERSRLTSENRQDLLEELQEIELAFHCYLTCAYVYVHYIRAPIIPLPEPPAEPLPEPEPPPDNVYQMPVALNSKNFPGLSFRLEISTGKSSGNQ